LVSLRNRTHAEQRRCWPARTCNTPITSYGQRNAKHAAVTEKPRGPLRLHGNVLSAGFGERVEKRSKANVKRL